MAILEKSLRLIPKILLLRFNLMKRQLSIKENFATLTLAYGVSIHKSQGQEYPIVIIPLMKSYHRMLTRRLLYTAVTRAKEKLFSLVPWLLFYGCK